MAVSPNRRAAMAIAGLEAARTYEKEALERVRRMSIAAADLELKGFKRVPGQGGPGGQMGHQVTTDKWYDDTMRGIYGGGGQEA